MRTREDFLDISRCIAILAVVYIHASVLFLYYRSNTFIAALSGFSRFCVPLFLLISGYLHANSPQNNATDTRSFFKIISKRFSRIMVPYFIFSTFYMIIRIVLEHFHFFQKLAPVKYQSFSSIFLAITLVKENPAGHLYFLVLLFFTTVVFIVGITIFFRNRMFFIWLCVLATMVAYFWWGDIYRSVNPLKGIGFYALGYFIYNNFPKKGLHFYLITILLMTSYIGGTLLLFKVKSTILLFLVHATGAIAVLFCSFAFSKLLKNGLLKNAILSIGKNSFKIYLLHEPYIVTVLFISSVKIAGLNMYVSLLLTFIAGILLPLLINKVILSRYAFFNKI